MKKFSAIAQTFILTSFSVLSLLAAPAQAASFRGLGSVSPYGISADGSVVVGSSYSNGKYEAFRWTQETGMVSLKETLIGAGLDVSGWSLISVNAISADGFTIVGSGTNPSGQSEAWVANIEPVPELLTVLGSIAAIAFCTAFKRQLDQNQSEEKDPVD